MNSASRFSTEELLEMIDRNAVRSDEGGILSELAQDLVSARRELVRMRWDNKQRRFDAAFDACRLARSLWTVMEPDVDPDALSRARENLSRHSEPQEGFVHGGPCGFHPAFKTDGSVSRED